MFTYNGNIVTYGGNWVRPDPVNPVYLPPYTIRLRFFDGYTPTFHKGTGVQVSSGTGANIWDLTYENSDWSLLLGYATSSLVEVVAANTSGVTNMNALFESSNLTTLPLFDTSNVRDMGYMFENCRLLTTLPALDTSNVRNMSHMLYLCPSLSSLPMLDTSNVTDMSYMLDQSDYTGNNALTTMPLWDMSSVTTTEYMFHNCTALATVPLLDLSSVVNMRSMFNLCSGLPSVPTFDTSSATNMNSMFNQCSSLTAIPLFDTADVTDVNAMFSGCVNVQSGALALYTQLSSQTVPPTNYSYCFNHCGENTVTGAAELAQIPTSWGGTMV